MTGPLFNETEDKMKKAIEAMRKDLASLRAGRANPALLEKIQVDYYGSLTPINQLAGVSAPEPRLLVVQPWDKTVIPAIEKSILKSDLGLNPSNDGNVIRLSIPQLTQERREELVKVVRKKAEEFRVVVRNARRDANELIKTMEKSRELSEDDAKRAQEQIQKLTDNYIEEVDKTLNNKEAEIMEV